MLGIAIKSGVDVSGVRPEIVLAIVIARSLFYSVRVTSVGDVHTGRVSGSLHNVGLAVDLVPGEHLLLERAGQRLASALGPQYDVVVESDHIHVEFQPG